MARPTLFSNRKFLKLATRLQSEALALGHLEFLWHAANESGNPLLGDADDVEATARWRGARGELAAALAEAGSAGGAGFIIPVADGRFEIHDYWHHAPDYVRKRAKREKERVEKGDGFKRDQSSTGQNTPNAPTTDRAVTGQKGVFQDSQSGVARTPAPAPAPAPAQRREDSPLAIARGAPVSGETAVEQLDLSGKPAVPPQRNGLDRGLEQAIIAAYHESLPDFPRIRIWDEIDHRNLGARVRQTVKRGMPANTVDYWKKFFDRVSHSDFLCGRRKDWRCGGLSWLVKAKNFKSVVNGDYDNNNARRRA